MSRIVVPLDGLSEVDALKLAAELRGTVWGFKVNDLLLDSGLSIIQKLKSYGSVFADPKLHDIPNTVANSVERLDAAGADLITVHGSGGRKMVEAAVGAARRARILVVTVLTSLDAQQCDEVYGRGTADQSLRLMKLAAKCKAFGVICSPEELSLLGEHPEIAALKPITPGIRPSWYAKTDDQVRIATPAGAFQAGAYLLVIGRPITADPNPRAAAQRVNEEVGE